MKFLLIIHKAINQMLMLILGSVRSKNCNVLLRALILVFFLFGLESLIFMIGWIKVKCKESDDQKQRDTHEHEMQKA